MKQLATKGIILRRIDYGEADRIITLLTSDYGKIRVMARGVRKSKSKLAGGIELFSVSELHFIKGKGDIDTLVSTRLIVHYGEIVKDLERTQLAYNFLKHIDRTVEDTAGSDYFDLLHESLAGLGDQRIPALVIEVSFMMRMLALLGQAPQFSVDVQGRPLDETGRYEFDFESVSFVPRSDGPFDKNHIKVLKLLAHNPPQAMAAVQGIFCYCQELSPLIRGLAGQYIPN